MSGLTADVTVKIDKFGVPHITANDRDDAFVALGYVVARDRLFQMDLLRRRSAGRLAEIFGEGLIDDDRWARTMGFGQLAESVFARLPEEHKRALRAHAAGVNQLMRDTLAWPWEFYFLGYRPEPWRAEDSILVAFNLAKLSYTESQERTASVMRATLPKEVVAFLTPESNCYNERLAASHGDDHCSPRVPTDALAELAAESRPSK
ncbi:MAG: penicillin acylase family protein, partial [Methylocystis sp.]|nr:penicillin acylase family protein [Methylocystis sp.]